MLHKSWSVQVFQGPEQTGAGGFQISPAMHVLYFSSTSHAVPTNIYLFQPELKPIISQPSRIAIQVAWSAAGKP